MQMGPQSLAPPALFAGHLTQAPWLQLSFGPLQMPGKYPGLQGGLLRAEHGSVGYWQMM